MALPEGLTASVLLRRSNRPASQGGADPVRDVKKAVTAAAVKLQESLGGKGRVKNTPWQERAWDYYDTLGEIQYAADFFGSNLARIRLIVQERDAQGEWAEVTSGSPAEALDRLRGPRGDRAGIQKAYGEINFIVGEGYLFGTRDGDANVEVWEFLSGAEVRFKDKKIHRKDSADARANSEQVYDPATTLSPAVGEAVALRLWTPHPRFSGDPKAPMQAVLDQCEELRLLPRAVRSRARSRFASSGVLAIPSEISESSGNGQDENPDEDIFLTNLINAAQTSISDEDSAATVVPVLLRADAQYLDKIQHITFTDPSSAYPETEREVHVVQRLAQGLKLPIEVLTGTGDVNHWGSWQITESLWTQHLEPEAVQMVGDLTSAFLAPVLNDTEGRYRIWYDPAALVTKPDRSADAKDAYDRLAISWATYREALGWDDTDAPDEAERRVRLGVLLNDSGLALGGDPTGGGSPPASGDGSGEPPASPATTDKAPPPAEGDAATAGAMRVGVARCREAAGAKVLTRLQRVPESERPALGGISRATVCAHLGADELARLGLNPAQLVAGAAACLQEAGYPKAIATKVERHAAATLLDRDPAPLLPR